MGTSACWDARRSFLQKCSRASPALWSQVSDNEAAAFELCPWLVDNERVIRVLLRGDAGGGGEEGGAGGERHSGGTRAVPVLSGVAHALLSDDWLPLCRYDDRHQSGPERNRRGALVYPTTGAAQTVIKG